MSIENIHIGVIGLGYVGLPIAVEFSKVNKVVAFDTNADRIHELKSGLDSTKEISFEALERATEIVFTTSLKELEQVNFFIIAVPTPIDEYKRPDLSALILASEMVAHVLKTGDIVVYESTVYPGATEEVCVPVLERHSKLVFNQDFFCGYSPERINPGDPDHRLPNIVKVVSGSTPGTLEIVASVYEGVIAAGIHRAESIKVAEAAKVIENTQRDLNIALMNELVMIFEKLGINTFSVLEAAGTKWNFLSFKPGLVGGHCIGVDPYYLTHKSQASGYHPELILAGRRINDNMGSYVALRLVREMSRNFTPINGAKVLIMGFAYKENCTDFRNTRVFDIFTELRAFGIDVDIFDPLINSNKVLEEYGLSLIERVIANHYDAVLIATPHTFFKEIGFVEIEKFGKENVVFFDVNGLFRETGRVVVL